MEGSFRQRREVEKTYFSSSKYFGIALASGAGSREKGEASQGLEPSHAKVKIKYRLYLVGTGSW